MTDLALALLGTFESLRMGPTFARGRRDERAGHVRSLTVSGSLAVAQVRGPDDSSSFRARLAVRSFGAAEWARIEHALASEARYTADLLAGRMPDGLVNVFAAEGLSLVPLSLDEVAMDCTCERWPLPCAHLTATIYGLARAFEEDPFGVMTWRGRSRDELLLHLRDLRAGLAVDGLLTPPAAGSAGAASGEPFPAGGSDPDGRDGSLGEIAGFWGEYPAKVVPDAAAGTGIVVAGRSDALLDELDPPPIAQDGRPIVDLLRPAYRALPER